MTTDDLDPSEDYDPGPFVCPGCYAVGDERCAPDCPDSAIARAREEAYWRDDEDDDDDWEWRS